MIVNMFRIVYRYEMAMSFSMTPMRVARPANAVADEGTASGGEL